MKKQILFERGLWEESMVDTGPEDDTARDQSQSMTHVLGECEDFRNEITSLEELVRRSGRILRMTPKGHCELAGQGIAYCWGKSTKLYRHNHKMHERNIKPLVLQSMSPRGADAEMRMFSRLARAYVARYAAVGGVTLSTPTSSVCPETLSTFSRCSYSHFE
jgi:hypothetical protein